MKEKYRIVINVKIEGSLRQQLANLEEDGISTKVSAKPLLLVSARERIEQNNAPINHSHIISGRFFSLIVQLPTLLCPPSVQVVCNNRKERSPPALRGRKKRDDLLFHGLFCSVT